MNRVRVIAVATLLALGGAVQAQLLAEVALTPAIASQLFPAVAFPPNSYRAVGSGTDALVARVADAGAWTGWEVYRLTGFVAALEPAVAYDVERGLMLDGYLRDQTTTSQVGAERHTRIVFADGGRRALLYLIRTDRELVWLVARAR